jgi:fatty-acyl-CoA synthase
MNNSHRFFELHYSVPGIGAMIVPINSRLAVEEMKHIISDCGCLFRCVGWSENGFCSGNGSGSAA